MTDVIPFRGIHYNREKVSGEVAAPPYDVITPAMREELYAKSPYNVVRIDFGMENTGDSEEDNKYTRASGYMESWLEKGVLMRSASPCYYAYRMEFDSPSGRKSLTGFYGLTRLVELGNGVYPHEATHSKPKKDRLSLMQEAGANTSSIYSLYRSERSSAVREVLGRVTSAEPYLSSTDSDGTVHSFWIIEAKADVEAMKDALSGISVFIADGHHRYETAMEYQRLMQESGSTDSPSPHDYVLMFLADIEDPALVALPTHRLVTVDTETLREKLSGNFDFEDLPAEADLAEAIKGKEHSFGLYCAGGSKHCLTCRSADLEEVEPELKGLDVVILHKLIFGKLLEVGNWGYEMDYATTVKMVDEGEYDAALFLNPTAVGDVERVALAGLRMPPKSTYFYPKVQTGFVINTLKSF